jgi:hypothetical protein
MDCDQVFMILTRGPFPTGAPSDEQVEEHLETCADCWRLAEALRPALELFQEAVPPIESRELPGYWGDARPAAAVMAQLTGTAARVAPAVGTRPIANPLRRPAVAPLETRFAADLLPTFAMMSALAAAVVGLVMWLRG